MKGYFPENSPEKGSETLTYIDRINEFHLWLESNALPVLSQLMYYNLLHVFNRAGWPEYVQVDNLRMMIWLGGASKTTVIRAREKLAAAGFIRFKRGGKGCPNRYELVNFRYSHDTINDTRNATENATENDTRTDTPSDTHIKTKTKTKKSPPKAPQGTGEGLEVKTASGAAEAVYRPKTPSLAEAFQRFWSAYPRKVGKGAARTAWEKLRPEESLVQQIVAAVERDKATDQWQREAGRFIPYPATWLNQRRWEDEPDTGLEPPPPAPEPYHYPTPEEDSPRLLDDSMDIDWRDFI